MLHTDLVEWRVPLHSLMLGCNMMQHLLAARSAQCLGAGARGALECRSQRFAAFITHNATWTLKSPPFMFPHRSVPCWLGM